MKKGKKEGEMKEKELMDMDNSMVTVGARKGEMEEAIWEISGDGEK